MVRNALLLLLLLVLLAGCGGQQVRRDPTQPIVPAKKPVSQYVHDDVDYSVEAYDPWERFNRGMYIFNYYFDKYVFLPVVSVYEWVLPDYVEDRISGIFKNFAELRNLFNNLLQLKIQRAVDTTGRLVINTTVGLGGMYDLATDWGLKERREDFGQTLGFYGLGAGPYLVLPIFGPSSLRDAGGLAVDSFLRSAELDWALDDVDHKSKVRTGIDLTEAVDTRHRIPFRYYQSGSPFEYEFLRKLYLEKRKMDVAK
ncbi:MAG: VacJ family lipoprotein [Deltaproteobacteria bacterium]|nr:VacJ family lipoprotein [Deltaproteobacteria bacterium]